MAEFNTGDESLFPTNSQQVDQSTARETQADASDDLVSSTSNNVHSGCHGLIESETQAEGTTVVDQLSDIFGAVWSCGNGLEQNLVRPGIRLSLDTLGVPPNITQLVETPITLAFLLAGLYFITASSVLIVEETMVFLVILFGHTIHHGCSVFLQVLALMPFTILFFASITITGIVTNVILRSSTAPLSQNADAWSAHVAQAREQYEALRGTAFMVDWRDVVDRLSPWKQRISGGLTFIQTRVPDQQPLVKTIALLALVFTLVRDAILALPILVFRLFSGLLPSLSSMLGIVYFSAASFLASSISGFANTEPSASPSAEPTRAPPSPDSSEAESEQTEHIAGGPSVDFHQAVQLLHSIKRDMQSSLTSFVQLSRALVASANCRRQCAVVLRVAIASLFFVFRWKGKLLMTAVLGSYGISKAIRRCCFRQGRRRRRENGLKDD